MPIKREACSDSVCFNILDSKRQDSQLHGTSKGQEMRDNNAAVPVIFGDAGAMPAARQ